MSELRRKYNPAFREGAVRIVCKTGNSIAAVAEALGSTRALSGNGSRKTESNAVSPTGSTSTNEINWPCWSVRTQSSGWSVMSSGDPWSAASARRGYDRGELSPS